MSFSVFGEPPSGMVLKLSGLINNEEFVSAVQAVHKHENYAALRYVIDDLSDVQEFTVDATTVLHVFADSVGAGETNPNRKIYVVATNETVVRYMNLMLAKYEGALPISRYDSLEEARQAIERDLADSQSLLIRKS